MKLPLISIVMPAYERPEMFAQALQTALNQTYENYEIVITDNSGSDQISSLINSLDTKHRRRITYVKNFSNIGPALNLHKAIHLANGLYTQVLFSDDLLLPDTLDRRVKSFKEEISLVYGPVLAADKDLNVTGTFYGVFDKDVQILSLPFILMYISNRACFPVSPGAAMFRTIDLRSSYMAELDNFDEKDFLETGAGLDYLVFPNIASKFPKVHYDSTPGVVFRSHPGSLTTANMDNKVEGCYTRAREYLQHLYSSTLLKI